MKKKMMLVGIVFLLLQLSKYLLIVDYAKDYGANRLEMLLEKNSGVSYSGMLFQEAYSIYNPVLIAEVENVPNDKGQSITVVGTTANAGEVERLRLVNGAFFGKEATTEGRNVAVISDQLSIVLFGSTNGVGNTMHLQEQVYQIVGVYKKYEHLRDYIGDDGFEKIYVPITSTITKESNVSEVIIDGTYLETMPNNTELKQLGIQIQELDTNSQEDWVKKNYSVGQIPLIVLWLIVGIEGGIRLYRWGRQYKSVQFNKWLFAIRIIAYLGSCYLLFRVAFDRIYINPANLPQENIFDLTFYWKQLKVEWIKHNRFVAKGVSGFEQARYLLMLVLHILNIIQYGLLINLGWSWKQYSKLDSHLDSVLVSRKN